jgi:hypothetical protein
VLVRGPERLGVVHLQVVVEVQRRDGEAGELGGGRGYLGERSETSSSDIHSAKEMTSLGRHSIRTTFSDV